MQSRPLGVSSCAAALALLGAQAHAGVAPDTVVITGTRVPESSAQLPMSIDQIGQRQIQEGKLQVNISESLNSVPGVNAQLRQNYAQDLQVSVRGFGARSGFGVRGVRLYADGIPGTMPDGQGQFSHFDLGSAGRIEVLRGPFSSLYGNSSGGVIAMFTEDAPPGTRVAATLQAGGFGVQRWALKATAQPGSVNLVVDAAHFSTNGYRDHSAAERNTFNAKARWQLDERSEVTLIANALDMPQAQDPLGLTREQLSVDPQQAGTNAVAYNTRKSVRQEQAGVAYERTFGAADVLRGLVYTGHRRTTQFQAIPRAIEFARPTHPGGVIDLDRNFAGVDLHYTDQRALARGMLQLTGGISYDNLDEARQGYLNFVGEQLGVQGALRRDERNRVYDLDEYLQAQWDSHLRWLTVVGVRHSVVDITTHNHLTALPAASRSGVRFSAFNPIAGLTYRAAPGLNVYGAYGKGFETPTLNDLAYRSTDGSLTGLNYGLRPARSDNFELGMKTEAPGFQATVAGFYINTHDELAVQSSSGGRTVFKNIVQTQRKGAELAMSSTWSTGFMAHLAYTYIEAETNTGHRLPAVAANTLYAALTWRHKPDSFSLTLEALGRAHFYVNDANSDAAAGYWVENLHFDLNQQQGAWMFNESLRIDNLTDRAYVGSVIVNESNSRFFEPEPGRTVYAMLTVTPGLRRTSMDIHPQWYLV